MRPINLCIQLRIVSRRLDLNQHILFDFCYFCVLLLQRWAISLEPLNKFNTNCKNVPTRLFDFSRYVIPVRLPKCNWQDAGASLPKSRVLLARHSFIHGASQPTNIVNSASEHGFYVGRERWHARERAFTCICVRAWLLLAAEEDFLFGPWLMLWFGLPAILWTLWTARSESARSVVGRRILAPCFLVGFFVRGDANIIYSCLFDV